VHRRDELDRVAFVDEANGARIGDAWHGETRDRVQRGFQIERVGERRARLREEIRPGQPVQGTASSANSRSDRAGTS
jgi:hypothetical protein